LSSIYSPPTDTHRYGYMVSTAQKLEIQLDCAMALLHSMMQLHCCSRVSGGNIEEAKARLLEAGAWCEARLAEYELGSRRDLLEAFRRVHREQIKELSDAAGGRE
jgi:hypothetical protein